MYGLLLPVFDRWGKNQRTTNSHSPGILHHPRAIFLDSWWHNLFSLGDLVQCFTVLWLVLFLLKSLQKLVTNFPSFGQSFFDTFDLLNYFLILWFIIFQCYGENTIISLSLDALLPCPAIFFKVYLCTAGKCDLWAELVSLTYMG